MFGFREVVVADFEFHQPPGEGPSPICLAALDLVSVRTHRIFGDELLARRQPPYPVGPDSLFVAYYASAESGSIWHSTGRRRRIRSTSSQSSVARPMAGSCLVALAFWAPLAITA